MLKNMEEINIGNITIDDESSLFSTSGAVVVDRFDELEKDHEELKRKVNELESFIESLKSIKDGCLFFCLRNAKISIFHFILSCKCTLVGFNYAIFENISIGY